MMNYYQHQKSQHFQQSHFQNSMNLLIKCYSLTVISKFTFYCVLTNLTVPNKHSFSVKLLAGFCGQVFNSQTMYKFLIKLTCNEEKLSCTKTELLNFNLLYHQLNQTLSIQGQYPMVYFVQMIFQSISSQQLFYYYLILGS